MNLPAVVVTGVSSGIGRAAATLLTQRGFHVFGSVRKNADAQTLRNALGERFTPLVFDITDEAGVRAAAQQVSTALGRSRLAGLVNNAGVAVAGPLTHLPVADFRHQIEVNLVAPMAVTQAFLPLLGTDPEREGRPGRVLMISSVGGKLAVPFLAPYVASKHGLEGLAGSLRRELMFYGIDVVVIAPGHVATPIWDKAEEMDVSPYEHLAIASAMQKFRDFFIHEGKQGFPPAHIAEIVHRALTVASPKTRYAAVPGKLKNWTIPRLLPDRVIDRVLAANLGLKPKP
jgi:NAD(P)-dependent dehydrogenase (short-subunit alcohol dehydrogenase family)